MFRAHIGSSISSRRLCASHKSMSSNNQNNSGWSQLISNVIGFPIPDFIQGIKDTSKRLKTVISPSESYEVLHYESTLELKDTTGEAATFWKREHVRYIQNNVIALHDHAWGDGEILINYQSSPGKVVDISHPGQKTTALIALQNTRQFGDEDEFQFVWQMRNCFTRTTELWETSVNHETKTLRINIIFPPERPPLKVFRIEEIHKTCNQVKAEDITHLIDRRWMVHWNIPNPNKNEKYLIQWDW